MTEGDREGKSFNLPAVTMLSEAFRSLLLAWLPLVLTRESQKARERKSGSEERDRASERARERESERESEGRRREYKR